MNPYIDIRDYAGAVNDAFAFTDGAITATSTTFTSLLANFTGTSGKTIVIRGAGGSGDFLVTTIVSIVSAHEITLADAASTTVSCAYFVYGTDSSSGIDNIDDAISVADTAGVQLYIPSGHSYLYPSELALPIAGVLGGGAILGVKCTYKYHLAGLIIDSFKCSDFELAGTWNSEIRHLTCNEFLINGGNLGHTVGTYTNKIGSLMCETLIIDCDNGPVNQNSFYNVTIFGRNYDCSGQYGGIHIKGIATPPDPSDAFCYNNVFSGVNIYCQGLYGQSGCQILNDSVSNQSNQIINWNGETGGLTPYNTPFIKGNWHLLGSQLDARASIVRTSDRNHFLFSQVSDVSDNGDADFFAGGIGNLAIGGEWDVLDGNWEKPYCLWYDDYVFPATIPYSATSCPSSIDKQITLETTTPYQALYIDKLNLPEEKDLILCMWYKGDDFELIKSDSNIEAPADGIYHDPVSGWKLLRVKVNGVTNTIRCFFNDAVGNSKKIAINSLFITDKKTAFLPQKKFDFIVRGSQTIASGTSSITIPIPASASNPDLKGTITVYIKTIGGATSASGIIKAIFSRKNGTAVELNRSGDTAFYYSTPPLTPFSFTIDMMTGDLILNTPNYGSQIQINWQINPEPFF